MNVTDLLTAALPLLQPIIAIALTALSAYLTIWIRGKVKNEKAAEAIVRAKDLVFALVKKANQTIADGIRAASADGSITDAEKKTIKDGVVSDFKLVLGPDGLKMLGYALGISTTAGALDAWIDTQIEAAVHDVKMLKAAATPPSASFQSAPPKP